MVEPVDPTDRALTAVDVAALGVRVRVETANEEIVRELNRAWSECVLAVDGEPEASLAPDDDISARSLDATMEQLTQGITVAAVSSRAGELLMLHACAVADPHSGRAVVMVGPSGMGKTTLSATLGKTWAYVSDETAAVREDGALLPYAKPLSVRTDGESAKRQFSPAELGLFVAREPLTVDTVLLLDRREDSVLDVDEVPTVPSIALLAEHTSYLAALSGPLHRIADLLHGTGGLRRVTYSEAVDLKPLVSEVLGGSHVD